MPDVEAAIKKRLEKQTRAIVTVGDGRGFIIDTEPRLIVTAAHFLPELPPPHKLSYQEERTYKELLRPLTKPRPTI